MSKIWLVVFGVIVALVVMVQFQDVFAASMEEIDIEIQSLQAKLLSYDGMITEAKKAMVDSERLLKDKKEELRIAKRDQGKSWGGTEKVGSVQKLVGDASKSVQDARTKYISLIKEKSDVIKKIKELKSSKKVIELQLQVAGRPTGQAKIIGVDLSQGCISQIKNKFKTDCPDYFELAKFDNSRQEVSGFFVDDGYYHRENPTQLNSWRVYDYDGIPRIIVDPPLGMSERIRLITIQDNFSVYLLPDSRFVKPSYQLVNMTKSADEWGKNGTYSGLNKTSYFNVIDTASRIIYHDRYVDDKCWHAIINADKWEILLPDTINYMRNNCSDAHTSFIHKEVIIEKLTPQDISTSQKYKDEQRLKWIIQNCLKTYGVCKP